MKIYEFSQPFYPFRLMACVGADAIRGFFEVDCDTLEDNCPAMTACRVTVKGGENAVLFRFRNADAIEFVNVAHECGHMGIDVFEYIDSPINESSSEAFCYLIGWAGGCLGWLKEKLSGKGRKYGQYAGKVIYDTDIPK